MLSERMQRQVDRLLDQVEGAIEAGDWAQAREKGQAVLRIDPGNRDALGYLAAAERDPAAGTESGPHERSSPAAMPPDQHDGFPLTPVPFGRASGPGVAPAPQSFANGRYEVKRFLGEGGKKLVYLAHDRQLDRDVAFALIKTEGLDDAGRQRIQREAQAMGRLGSHPHVVSVFDIGDEVGQPFIITELMGGGDVEGLIEHAPDHRLPLDRALQIAIETCQGLEFAHAQGIVHRDLKPGNVWLTADGVAKIGDFGLAVATDRSRLTQAGMMVGTVSYMPPEQAMGGEVTPRSDLYSLGALLYELVTGRPPFVGDESVAIIGQHLNTPPVAPSWHRPDCPVGLETLILRLLEKDAGKRPTSAAEVRSALTRVNLSPSPSPARGGEPDDGDGTSPPSRAGKGAGGLGLSGAGGFGPAPLYRRVFVGRQAELRQLQGAFDNALSGQGALVAVVGEPGIGKTALCEQLGTYAALRGGRALVGHCYEEGSLSLPYLAFIEAMRSYVLERDPAGLTQDLGTGAGEIARLVSEVRLRVGVEPTPSGADPEEERWRLYQAVVGFLRNASAVQPLLIVLEDLHWADRGTLDLLLHLTRQLAGARLLVIGTYRDVEVDRAHPLAGALAELRRSSGFTRVALRGLHTPEVQRMVAGIAGQEVPLSLAEAVFRQTEGNPLFVQEVARYLVEEGLLTGGRAGDGGRGMDATAIAMSLPEGLREVIGKRLSRLSAESNRVLAMGAVIGREFALATLRTVSPLGEEALVDALDEAVHVGVLEEEAKIGQVRYRFAHAYFRQTLYEELSAPRRIQLHQQVARALEQQYLGRLEEHAAELAEHFAHSSDATDLAKAVGYGERAAQRAVAVNAYGEAVRHLERALEVQEVLDPHDRAKCCDLLLALGDALLPAGEPQRVAQVVAPDALALAEALPNQPRAFRACTLGALGLLLYGRTTSAGSSSPEFRSWAEKADRYAAPGTIERVRADEFLQLVARNEGDEQRCQELATRSFHLAQELGDVKSVIGSAAPLLNGTYTPPEHHNQRLEVMQQVRTLPVEGVPDSDLRRFLDGLASVDLTWGDRTTAEANLGRIAEVATRTSQPVFQLQRMAGVTLSLMLDGHLIEAVELAEELGKRGEELGSAAAGRQLGTACSRRALVYLGRSLEALDKIPASQNLWSSGGVFAGQRAMCLAHAGRTEEAKEILSQFRTARDLASPDDPSPAIFLRYLLDAAVAAEDLDTLAAIYPRLAPLSHLLVTEANHVYCIGRLCGGAAVLLGYPERAREHYQQALEICTRVRFRPEIALTRLGLAELLLDGSAEERIEAQAHLDFAIEEFGVMQMRPSLERALSHKGLLHA